MQTPQKIFFSGIGGAGVSALAGFCAMKGHSVYGSDRAFSQNPNHPAIKPLLDLGIKVVPQDGAVLDSTFDLVVFSTAVEPGHVELNKASELGIKTLSRPEFLAKLVRDFASIAVAGTSGKSTTSGMLAYCLSKLGSSPNFIGGGRVRQFKSINKLGNFLVGHSQSLVIEACESDGSIVNYLPKHTILLNLELDHHSIESTAEMFKRLIQNTSQLVAYNADDAKLHKIIPPQAVGFSLKAPSKYHASEITLEPFRASFVLHRQGFKLKLAGMYNIYNALACIAILSELGYKLSDIAEALSTFEGIDRRFSIHYVDANRFVIDDYAHNPHKIASMLEATQLASTSICYIFQPHGYAPTRMMKDEYVATFVKHLRETDCLILLPIYYAGGTVQKDISSETLASLIQRHGKAAKAVTDRQEVFKLLNKWQSFVVFGARDESLSELAEAIAQRIKSSIQ